jgi:branched-chain amino acid transport system substrate-binding protein
MKVIAMSSCAGSPKFAAKGAGEYAFSMGYPAPEDGYAAAQWAFKSRGWTRAYLLIDQFLDYCKTSGAGFEQRFKELGGTIVLKDTFSNPDPSIATQISKLKKVVGKVDVIMHASFPPGGASAIRQIRAAGIDLPMVSGDGHDGAFWMDATPNLSNWYTMDYGSIHGDDPRPEFNELCDAIEKRYGERPIASNVSTGYDVGQAFILALERTGGKTDGDSLKRAIESFKCENFMTGKVSFSPELHACQGRDYYVVETQNGKRSYLEKVQQGLLPNLRDFVK